MHSASRNETFDVPIDAFYGAVVTYKAYPEFVPQLTHVRMLKPDGDVIRAKFTAHYIRDIEYVLRLHHDEPKHVWWELEKSDVFEVNSGSWTLKKKGKSSVDVTYEVDVVAKIPIPRMIVNKLTARGLPYLMQSFADRALSHHAD